MCSSGALHGSDLAKDAVDRLAKVPLQRRTKIWEIKGGLQCSIVGTCLTHGDLLRIARRAKLEIEPRATEYQIHGYFVDQAGKDDLIARLLNKELERKYAAIVRKVGKVTDRESLEALWRAEYEAGRIGGAYWAFLSHTHIPRELRDLIFGEVHMLSHVLGRTTHAAASRVEGFETQLAELEDKLRRQADRHTQALSERDRTIADLRQKLLEKDGNTAQSGNDWKRPSQNTANKRVERLLLRRERAIVSARKRARDAEAQVDHLRHRLDTLVREHQRALLLKAEACPGAAACDVSAEPRRVLYLGGRTHTIERLRKIAESANADFLHHDGGIEQSSQRIDGLIEGCDAVFCPIDCISHGACLKAKSLCRKFGKQFVPLRSSGVTTFQSALTELCKAS